MDDQRAICPRCHGAGRYEWAGTTEDCGACGADGWVAQSDQDDDAFSLLRAAGLRWDDEEGLVNGA
jgi:uncharacterized protein (DUF983 family)